MKPTATLYRNLSWPWTWKRPYAHIRLNVSERQLDVLISEDKLSNRLANRVHCTVLTTVAIPSFMWIMSRNGMKGVISTSSVPEMRQNPGLVCQMWVGADSYVFSWLNSSLRGCAWGNGKLQLSRVLYAPKEINAEDFQKQYLVSAIKRCFDLIDLLVEKEKGLTMSEIHRALHLPPRPARALRLS